MSFNFKFAFKLSFLYFIVTSFLGLLLRSFHFFPLIGEYKHWLHTHSHIALLGWAYNGISLLIAFLFFKESTKSKYFKANFIFTQLCLLAMFLSFPIQGYAFYSILASSLFIISNYIFTFHSLKYTAIDIQKKVSFKFIKWSFFYLVLSSLGTWSLGAIISNLGATSIWYKLAIYFYLHFQYNGWLIMAIIGIFFKLIEDKEYYNPRIAKRVLYSSNIGIILSYSLSTLWVNPPLIIYIIGFISAFFIGLSFLYLSKIIRITIKNKDFKTSIFKLIYLFYTLKTILLMVSAIPQIGNILDQNRALVIGYLHLIFLGIISLFILGISQYLKLLKESKMGITLLSLGIILTEILLFYKGLYFWIQELTFENYPAVLLASSLLISIGALLVFRKSLLKDK